MNRNKRFVGDDFISIQFMAKISSLFTIVADGVATRDGFRAESSKRRDWELAAG
jgi:hypothetical protein